MRGLFLAVLPLLGATALASADKRATPTTLATSKTTTSPAQPTYQSCGGFRANPVECPDGQICIDDPYRGGCGMACDMPGICVEPVFCGGIAGIACKDGKKCVDDPRDDCDPENGGSDCGGICV
ncbi:6e8ca68b-0046-4407-ad3b-d2b103c2a774 [Thermothielavioides terrestris]|uniref:Uncharacterized protein n=2 Tax=Thermothielavioides terrestris TaxID=2587410 RepID=G2QW27_THETT|nr:uncharacterized protein THITE_2106106 [Thermothielavioides terrestris NRRL 8126]AEO62198.1 hypothetical protein THITE_2106106 [Thermothielavioides terrestris NRRL 8126]SPQ24996.1 6e8ca68b-0046-4407-ad3b-d2b103c2a774 [Thermothielavioides terrestris]